jgi:uncharacterized membrane protein
MTSLRFHGDWPVWLGLALALAAAGGAGWFYWRESRLRTGPLRWVLPALRALAVFLLVMVFSGPVLHHQKLIGEIARVLLLVDASASMSLADPTLDPHRKLLAAQQAGALPPDTYDPALSHAADALGRAVQAGNVPRRGLNNDQLAAQSQSFLREIEAAAAELARVKADTLPDAARQTDRFRRELLAPAMQLGGREGKSAARRSMAELTTLGGIAARWQKDLRRAQDDYVRRLALSNDALARKAVEEFDARSRWQRVESLLLGGKESLLAKLAAKHAVELRALAGPDTPLLWQPEAPGPGAATPASLALAPTNIASDLGDPARRAVDAVPGAPRTAVVIFSDGQHNSGPSPLSVAKALASRNVPMFTVGLGPETAPDDLAVLQATGPESVFMDDRARGQIHLKEDWPAGQSYLLKIEHQGRTIWAQTVKSEQKHARSVPFDFPIKETVQAELARQEAGLKFASLPLSLQVSATPLAPERITNNNTATLRFRTVTQRPKALVLDGRPRWEFRYLRNLFERDGKWEINALLAGAGGGEARPWPRGPGAGRFPADRETLFSYHLVVFGDLPAAYLKTEELEWIREFVEKRGGGVIFVDGRQEQLATYANTPLSALLPVGWQGGPLEGTGVQLRPTSRGNALTPLALSSNPQENALIWDSLPGPRWVAGATALPGADVLLNAVAPGRTVPALAFRRYGAGRVLYAAFDESWRWRFEVADKHHQRFWNQVARWIMDPVYPVEDKFVSLDAGPLVYAPGDQAELRVQVRDTQGRLLPRAKVEAHLFRAGARVAALPLSADESGGGIYRGQTTALTEGEYEVRVRVEGLPESDLKARATFLVEKPRPNELAELACNEALLRQMAAESNGEYLREEEAARLVDKLAPLSQGRIIESETILWQSWWWFGAVIVLLTLEWALRKRAGML